MDAPIRYLRSGDGTSIAYIDVGAGLPLTVLPELPFCHLQLEQESTALASWLEALGRGRRLIHYDARGTGLSDRLHPDFSVATQVADLEQVLDATKVERTAVFAMLHAAPIALAFAAEHPERVSHLVLWHAYARGSDMFLSEMAATIAELVQKNWELFTDALTVTNFGWTSAESAGEFSAMARAAISAEHARGAFPQIMANDVSDVLERIAAPTLVLTREQPVAPSLEVERGLAADIADAQLALIPGSGIAPWVGDVEATVAAIDAFLPAQAPTAAPAAIETLSPRELEVLRLLSAGHSNQRIADELTLSVGTVKSHVSNIFTKLQVTNRTQAVARARESALIR